MYSQSLKSSCLVSGECNTDSEWMVSTHWTDKEQTLWKFVELSRRIWSPLNLVHPDHIFQNIQSPRTISYRIYGLGGDSSFWNIWSPYESLCPPGLYILNCVETWSPPDHSLRNISRYMVPPLKRVPQDSIFRIVFLKYTAPLYCIMLQGDFSVMYCLPGVSSVVLILAKLQIIAFCVQLSSCL